MRNRKLTPLEQGRLWEAAWKRGRLRERQQGRPMRFRESATARSRRARRALDHYAPSTRRYLEATATFMASYAGWPNTRHAPAHSAIAAFRESYRRPER